MAIRKEVPRRQTLSQAVTQAMLERFRLGEFRVGDRLATEQELMQEFGVGRNVAREAVRALVVMGLVDVRPGRGAVVIGLWSGDGGDVSTLSALLADEAVDDLYEFRSVIEVAIAERAAVRASDADLHAVRRQFDRFRAAADDDPLALVEADIAFHSAIARASHNAVYVQILDSLQERLALARNLTVDIPWVRERTRQDHQQIMEALAQRQPAQAATAMRSHMELAIAGVKEARPRPAVGE